MKTSLLVVAGEASGDQLGAALVRALLERLPHVEVYGVGGVHMRAAGVETVFDVGDLNAVGAVEVLTKVPQGLRMAYQLLREARVRQTRAVILIDTPGYGPADWKQARALATAFAGLPGLDTHMVVAATSSAGHLRRTLDAFRIFHPRKLLITKLDECAEAGAIVGETLRFRLPISFFSTGQRIPEDIAAASPERLAQQLLQAF